MAAAANSLIRRLSASFAVLLCGTLAATGQAQEGSAEAGQSKSATCAACHGADGNSVTPEWPNLAGQHESYLVRQLMAYKDGERRDVGMQGFASTLSEQDMHDVAAYFSAQTLAPRGADPDLVMLGEQIYRGGIPERGVAACIACHGPTGMGNPMAAYPRISGQHSAYVLGTLQAYAAGERRSDADMNQMMRNLSELLFENEMRALASYVQGLR